MATPTQQQVVEALQNKNVPLECPSCKNATSFKLDVAGVTLTALGHAVNTSTSTLRNIPMALVICNACGDTRLFHLESLGFKPPF